MQLFVDSADLTAIRELAALGYVDGVTLNPKIVAQRDLGALVESICKLVRGTVSVPVRSSRDPLAIAAEARDLAGLDDRVIVKIPIQTAGLQAMARLHTEGIRTHATLCCTASQALLAARCGAYYVSPFLSRVEKMGEAARVLLENILEIYDNYQFDTRVMAASVHTMAQLELCAQLGVDACTLKPAMLSTLVHHPLGDILQAEYEAGWEG